MEQHSRLTEDDQDKKTLVFLHYFGGAAVSWNWLIDVLPTDYHCIALNLPGFGGTVAAQPPSIVNLAAFVSAQLAQMNLQNVILVGHSMGGKIALQVAIDDHTSKTISQLVLIGPSPPSVEKMPEKQQQTLREQPSIAVANQSVRESTVIPLLADPYATAIETQLLVDQSTREWWIDSGIKDSIAAQTQALTLPITVIASKTDPAITAEMTRTDTMPNLPDQANLVIVDYIGHLMPLEAPQLIADLLQNILLNG